ncbi:carbohydrate ABC transporter permease [Paenibacillus macerans]|uniref:carbohydrate ABC transporter permease n=1 Tax=Paenibacillus macerans TaxID=44252 RepID=UPI003D317970
MKSDTGYVKKLSERTLPYIFIGPAVILITLLAIVPLFYSVYISMLNYNLSLPSALIKFSGLDNYRYMFSNGPFMKSIGWTLVFTFFTVLLNVTLGMVLALILNNEKVSKQTRIFKSLFILPMMLAPVVSTTMWKILFGAIYGPINYLIESLGLQAVAWTGETLPAKIAVIMIDVWGSTPFCMLILIAALQTVPKDIYESAFIDGASRFKIFFRITLPLIRNFIALVVSLRVMDALKIFDSIMILTDGGPGDTTETMGTMIYKTAFRYMNVGAGSAGAIIFFAIIVVITLVFLRLIRNDRQ